MGTGSSAGERCREDPTSPLLLKGPVIAEDSLKVLVDQVKPWLGLGEVSTYLPELSRARSDELAVAIDLGGNGVISAGDHAATFTLQSVVKVFTLLLALHH